MVNSSRYTSKAAMRARKQEELVKRIKRYWQLYLLVLPPIITTFIWHYIPLYGVVIAFKDFTPKLGILGSPWAGFHHFVDFFNDPYFFDILWNTIRISLYNFCMFPFPIIFALMINELTNAKFKKFVQMISYLPHFISTVVICSMIHMFFNVDNGLVNNLLMALGVIEKPVGWLYSTKAFDHLYTLSGLWQGIGWGTIIYLANLANVSPDLIEAARIDGATRWQVVWNINIPTILPTVIIMLILRVGGILGVGFEKVFLLQTNLNMSVSRVISTYTYERTLGAGGTTAYWDYSAAIGLFNTFINLALIMTTNAISRKVGETSLF